ncbi:MAG TPA: type II secretion system protein [Verrucomicrobiae bacterium]|nr:type II secretion system protein [Verrucomicrobiae bacterium]
MSRARPLKPCSYAFSLVELLVVIGIVALLAALMAPVLLRAKARAHQIQCVSNEHQQGIALQAFVADSHKSPKVYLLFEDTTEAALVRWNRDHQPHRDSL